MNIIWKYAGVAVVIVGITALASVPQKMQTLDAPEKGGSKTYSLEASYHGEKIPLEITLSGKAYTEAEKRDILVKAEARLMEILPGANSSFMHITEDMNFPSKVGGLVQVTYQLDDYSCMNCFGELEEGIPEGGKDLNVVATLAFLDASIEKKIPIHIVPPEKSKIQVMEEQVKENLESQEVMDGKIQLPGEYGGNKVEFYTSSKNPVLILFGLVSVAVLYFYNDRVLRFKRQLERRTSQMQCDYSDIVSKLTLLIGAGLSTSSALSRIASDYREKTASGGAKRHAYEEVCITCNKLGLGVREEQAYTEFGRSCRSHCYLKLSSLLIQNMKKGNPGFFGILKNETTEAFMERKSAARCAGEVAGTKLLVPMGLQLMVVLVIIVVPAFMSF